MTKLRIPIIIALYSLISLLNARALRAGLSVDAALAVRFGVALAVELVFYTAKSLAPGVRARVAALGLVNVVVGSLAMLQAQRLLGSSVAVAFVQLAPGLVLLIELSRDRSRARPGSLAPVLVLALGAVVPIAASPAAPSLGYASGAIAALATAAYALGARRLSAIAAPEQLSRGVLAAGALGAWAVVAGHLGLHGSAPRFAIPAALAIAGAAGVLTTVASRLWIAEAQRRGSARAAALLNVVPIVVGALEALIGRRAPSPAWVIGAGLMAAGTVLLLRGDRAARATSDGER